MSVLKVKNLSVVYQTSKELVRALTGVSFSVESGSGLGLWGHSGCGKSTILKSILALPMDEPGWVEGEASFEGKPIAPHVERYVAMGSKGVIRKNAVGFYRNHRKLVQPHLTHSFRTIFQEPIYSFETGRQVGQQVRQVFLHIADGDQTQAGMLLDEFSTSLERLDLSLDYIDRRRNLQLSGGECQRIALAMSIVGTPKLLLADEPTTALDIKTREVANDMLMEKMRDTGMTLLVASHNRHELKKLVEKVVVLCKGVVVERFTKDWLIDKSPDMFHPYTRKLWFAMEEQANVLPGEIQRTDSELAKGCPFYSECADAAKDKSLQQLCQKTRPPFVSAGDGHEVACYLFNKSRISVDG